MTDLKNLNASEMYHLLDNMNPDDSFEHNKEIFIAALELFEREVDEDLEAAASIMHQIKSNIIMCAAKTNNIDYTKIYSNWSESSSNIMNF